ncbi:MAG: DUF6462 family protein [Lachnospiraceae bacterium]|nr:DUF6462 family protein [Lachnospiraceae bacterium]
MNKRIEPATENRTGRIEDACKRYGLGRTSMKSVAAAAGAEIKIGKSYLVNYAKVDAYMDSISGVQ